MTNSEDSKEHQSYTKKKTASRKKRKDDSGGTPIS
jgi:hypothetical protein